MSAPPTPCGRCGHVVAEGPVTVTLDGGPLHADGPTLYLCPRCADSMARWFRQRGQRHATPGGEPVRAEGTGEGTSPKKNRAARLLSKKRLKVIQAVGIYLAFSIACLAITWVVLSAFKMEP